jgi:hypothetical protein
MKTAWWGLVLAAATTAAGCVSLPTDAPEVRPPDAATTSRKPARTAPPVTAEELTEANARERADALLVELDREAQRDGDSSTRSRVSPEKR